MKVLVNARHSAAATAHGGPIMARRHAEALQRAGLQVVLAAPEKPQWPDPAHLMIAGYDADPSPSRYVPASRPNTGAERAFEALLETHRPDVVYDMGGPAWGVAAAARRAVPVVSSVAAYTWFCARDFLVDSNQRRCTGPESLAKCFTCETRAHPLKRRLVQEALRYLDRAGCPPTWTDSARLAPYRVWNELAESRAYLERLRSGVDCFVIGDRQAREFFIANGVPAAKIAYVPQCLPADALVRRPHTEPRDDPTRPLVAAFVGRLDVEKGFHVLAHAYEDLPDEAPIQLWVIHVTDATAERVAPMFRDAARFQRRLDAGDIRLIMPRTRDELYSSMARADVGIVPSIAYESPSLAMMEFAAQGTPVIRSESAGMEHVIQDGINGRTFPYGDASALSRILAQAAARRSEVAAWRERLPRIDDDSVFAAALVDVFARLLQRAPRERSVA